MGIFWFVAFTYIITFSVHGVSKQRVFRICHLPWRGSEAPYAWWWNLLQAPKIGRYPEYVAGNLCWVSLYFHIQMVWLTSIWWLIIDSSGHESHPALAEVFHAICHNLEICILSRCLHQNTSVGKMTSWCGSLNPIPRVWCCSIRSELAFHLEGIGFGGTTFQRKMHICLFYVIFIYFFCWSD